MCCDSRLNRILHEFVDDIYFKRSSLALNSGVCALVVSLYSGMNWICSVLSFFFFFSAPSFSIVIILTLMTMLFSLLLLFCFHFDMEHCVKNQPALCVGITFVSDVY